MNDTERTDEGELTPEELQEKSDEAREAQEPSEMEQALHELDEAVGGMVESRQKLADRLHL